MVSELRDETVVDARDERSHRPGVDALWAEGWTFDWAARDGRLGGFVAVVLLPHLGRTWYTACLVGEGRPVVVVVDHDVPLPRSGLELRTEGLWAAHNLETPLDHWSLGCEAFGVAVDEPVELDSDVRGDRVPFGHDLEWETGGPVAADPGGGRYVVPCRVTGEVLVGQEVVEVDAPGWRDHFWGVAPWWTSSLCRGWLARDGAPVAVDPGEMALLPVAPVPVRSTGPDGRTSLLTRTLVRTETGEVGWIEQV